MSGLKGVTSNEPVNQPEIGGSLSFFRRRSNHRRRWWVLPKRYVLALLCYAAFFLKSWMSMDFSVMFITFLTSDQENLEFHFPMVSNWTLRDIERMESSYFWGYALAQIPGGLLAVSYSAHKLMAISIACTSFLHMLTPTALYRNFTAIVVIICLQGLTVGSLNSACIGVWRDWAPPAEKSQLVVLSFSGIFLDLYVSLYLCDFLSERIGVTGIYYVSGIFGLIWCILWLALTSENPSSDPNITEAELAYLEDTIPTQNREKVHVSDIPFRSILTSSPVWCLSFVFIATWWTFYNTIFTIFFFSDMGNYPNSVTFFWVVLSTTVVVFIPASGFLFDFVRRKINRETTFIRKGFCSVSLILCSIFSFAIFIQDEMLAAVCFVLSVVSVSFSVVGYLPNALDLSPRYAPIIMSIAMACSSISGVAYDYVLGKILETMEWKLAFLASGILCLLAGILFALAGSGVEQCWSSATNRNSAPEDARCYPRTDYADRDILVSENL